MSNFLAIATVTAVLQRTLQASVQTDVDGARVTTLRPDAVNSGGTPETGVNIYLYHSIPNLAWRNADLRTRHSDGQFSKRPQCALDLHYLMTFYGDETELEPQRLMGSVLRTMHARPILTPEMIKDTIADASFSYLLASDLAHQIESITFGPIALTVEELSNLWSVFFQAPYALSFAYQATTVLIESDDIPMRALPVRARHFIVPPSKPYVEHILSGAGAYQPILPDSSLIIRGQRLMGDVTQVRINGMDLEPTETHKTQVQLSLAQVPAHVLRAGVQSLQVVTQTLTNGRTERAESNVSPFVLRPAVVAITTENLRENADGLCSGQVQVQLQPLVSKTQKVTLAMNEMTNENPRAYSFDAAPRQEDTDSVTFPIREVKPGEYLVRIMVDGTESVLSVDMNADSPTFDQFTGPLVAIA